MPTVSPAQHRLMEAAAHNRGGYGGVPQSVGREFVGKDAESEDFLQSARKFLRGLLGWVAEEEGESEHATDADPPKGHAASIAFVSPAGKVLFVKRAPTEENWPDTWSLPGGKRDGEETIEDCAMREAREEVGDCSFDGMSPLETKRTPYGWEHTTFVVPAKDEFEPKLNGEHSEHRWASLDEAPEPLHPGVKATIDGFKGKLAADTFEEGKHPRDSSGKFGSGGSHEHRMHELSGRQLESEIERAAQRSSQTGRALIDAGRGSEKHSETREKAKSGDPLSLAHTRAWAEETALREHRGERQRLGEKFVREHGRKELERRRSTADAESRTTVPKTTETAIGRVGSAIREDLPEHDFLLPAEKKYPVTNPETGKLDRELLLAAARRARMNGRSDLARKADRLRAEHFGAETAAHDAATPVRRLGETRAAFARRQEKTILQGVTVDLAMDRLITAIGQPVLAEDPTTVAFDRPTVRDKTLDGHLRVSKVHISKAAINDYLGSEINEVMKGEPGWKPLEPGKRYRMFRPPEELEKAVSTANGLPILSKHQSVSAKSHPAELVIGSTGSSAEFNDPHLDNAATFWPNEAIDNIESNATKQLSWGYRYKADMTPGTWNGQEFDGRMLDLIGNHVALVPEGRIGSSAIIGDRAPWTWALLEKVVSRISIH